MCGIVGYIGNKKVEEQLLNTLKLLEYREYDSSGLAVLKDRNIIVTKAEGKIESLEKIVKFSEGCLLGIAHTRWATHGKPTINNAHPHLSQNKEWAIVHNSIIENYSELKTKQI